jgi:hypothetical protein
VQRVDDQSGEVPEEGDVIRMNVGLPP